ncbi:hypothetical protein PG996_010575 [Apiospora saccharicola]|uniref:SET domain-containing protein n=1 Tax=Apiospora saccharicola TaxID=335842 RepID=A0ABR1UNZ2_9PEZI
MVITATRTIQKDEEITIAYTELLAKARDRRLDLVPFGFICKCEACDGSESTMHDAHRLAILHILDQLDDYDRGKGDMEDPKVALGLAAAMVHLLKATGIMGIHLDEAYSRCADHASELGDEELHEKFMHRVNND